MPKVSKDTATQGGEFGPVTDRFDELDGYTVNFTSFSAEIDGTPLLKGLQDDRCQCPHWGYLLKGRMRVFYKDHEEVINAGDAYYLAPGHTTAFDEETEVVEFSPKGEYQKTLEVAARNMAAMPHPEG